MRHNLVVWVMVPVLWGQACWTQQSAAPAEPNMFPGAIGAFRAMLDKAGIQYVYFESPEPLTNG